jgi:hypothetical protein
MFVGFIDWLGGLACKVLARLPGVYKTEALIVPGCMACPNEHSSFAKDRFKEDRGSSDWLGIWCDCLLARSLGRVMVGNQAPAPLLLYPHPGKASVTGNSLAFVLPIHY